MGRTHAPIGGGYKLGDRVRLNATAMTWRKLKHVDVDRIGIVIGGSADGQCVAVVWDGKKTRHVISPTFLLRVPKPDIIEYLVP